MNEFFKKFKMLVADNSPLILTYLSVAGVVSTAVLAVRATPKALEKIEQVHKENFMMDNPDAKNKEIIKVVWKDYTPAFVSGAFTIACIIGAQTINTRKNAAVVSLYSLTETALREYQAKVKEIHGENKEKKVRELVKQDSIASAPMALSEVHITGLGEQLCYDSFTGRYFKSDIETIRRAQNDINAQVLANNYASHNDFYKALGLSRTQFGEEAGWNLDQLLDIEFTSHLADDGRPCLCIEYQMNLKPNYYKMG
jgi:hypothetical protein